MVNLHGRLPTRGQFLDDQEVALLRRANLDMFWSRESGTVKGLVYDLKDIIKRASWRGRRMPLTTVTPWDIEDGQGMGIALLMLEKSIEKGRNNSTYKQFDTVRKFRSAASNVYTATAAASKDPRVLKSLKGAVLHTDGGSMQSVFMERFSLGMKTRMPQEKVRNLPLLGNVVSKVLEVMEASRNSPGTSRQRQREISMCAGYLAVTYVYGLRGNEGWWVDGDRLQSGIELGKVGTDEVPSHVVVSLLGRFKGEDGDRMHVFALASESGSGIKTRALLEKVAEILSEEKKEECPAFCDKEGFQLTERFVEDEFLHPILESLQSSNWGNGAISKGLSVRTSYRCFRSLRRGANITATNKGVSESTINFVHRWNKFELKRGRQPGFDMIQHYADGVNTRPLQISYSSSV
jgi:hypothetical protein